MESTQSTLKAKTSLKSSAINRQTVVGGLSSKSDSMAWLTSSATGRVTELDLVT